MEFEVVRRYTGRYFVEEVSQVEADSPEEAANKVVSGDFDNSDTEIFIGEFIEYDWSDNNVIVRGDDNKETEILIGSEEEEEHV